MSESHSSSILYDSDCEECSPDPASTIQSMRAFGYDLPTAIADIIDNSISNKARNVWIIERWNGVDSYIAFLDDGNGMDQKTLYEAMKLGSHNPLDDRDPMDLGRFGFGLKTASFSQCRLLTVRTKNNRTNVNTRCWDIDYVTEKAAWHLLKSARPESEKPLRFLDKVSHGTIVLWEKLDRIVQSSDAESEQGKKDFLRKIGNVKIYLEMVFHRYMESGRLSIYLSSPEEFGEDFTKLKPWDPFLYGKGTLEVWDNVLAHANKIKVRAFVLPHISKLTTIEHNEAAGPKGWNAQQGFYIYRNERMIVSGGWLGLGLKQEDHCKLARIMVDIPSSADSQWHIDVKKSEAHVPDSLRKEFKDIATIARARATEVYRYRGKQIVRNHDNINRFVWKQLENRDKTVKYSVDRKHPLIEDLINKHPESKKDVNLLIKLIESTVPIEQILIKNSDSPDAHLQAGCADDYKDLPIKQWFQDLVAIQEGKGLSREDAIKLVLTMQPFDQYPELAVSLDEGR